MSGEVMLGMVIVLGIVAVVLRMKRPEPIVIEREVAVPYIPPEVAMFLPEAFVDSKGAVVFKIGNYHYAVSSSGQIYKPVVMDTPETGMLVKWRSVTGERFAELIRPQAEELAAIHVGEHKALSAPKQKDNRQQNNNGRNSNQQPKGNMRQNSLPQERMGKRSDGKPLTMATEQDCDQYIYNDDVFNERYFHVPNGYEWVKANGKWHVELA